MAKVSLIIPAYNEEKTIAHAIARTKAALAGLDYEIIIAEDGSRDKTAEIVRGLADPRVLLLHSNGRLGRGKSLSNAIKFANGEIVAFFDSDLATDMSYLKRLIKGVEDGASISTGSRLKAGAQVEDINTRKLARKAYNFLVRLILGSKVLDHQCGFKAFRKKDVLPLLQKIKAGHWFWDTEILVLAQRQGLKVDEFPVKWKHGNSSKVNIFADAAGMFLQIIRMRFSG